MSLFGKFAVRLKSSCSGRSGCAPVIRAGFCWLAVLLLLALPGLTCAAVQTPKTVDVGIYLSNIPSVNLKEKKFQASFYIWFRWTGNEINPMENFGIVNGHIDSKEALNQKKIGNINYASCKVEATIYRNFDLSRYPLDHHALKIQIEDNQYSSADIAYRPDRENAGLSQKINVPGWVIGKFDSYVSSTAYPTNYGDISLSKNAESSFPRYTFSVDLKRGGYGSFIKLFSMLFLAAALSLCAFRIRSDHIDARFALVVSGVFLAALTQSTLASSLPENDSFCMADQLYNVTMGFILLVFIACIHTFNMYVGGAKEKANRLSRLHGIVFLVCYVVVNLIVVYAPQQIL